ncbi:IS21 family transposase [Paenibacillus naphthalenovorans]|uniref:IS21 family transposase n=1 Tax=Paenibacillus naphthalenovorans TaxID=162209 RepID=UPI0020C8B267|nr:IS21 family transposase [Paenibacillus naphthalenovorans]
MKAKGLKVSQIARKLNVSRNTVYKYMSMNPDEFKQFMEGLETRKKKLDPFEQRIIQWLREYSDLSAAQIWDWLKEHHPEIEVGESTVRSYVRLLRKMYGIPKETQQRQYEAIPDPPMGEQMQVDFGETKMKNLQGNLVKCWFITFVLSHSRQKFVHWQDRPFITKDVIDAHELAFAFYGGMTKEIIYDQDHLLLTSENYGDLILTHEFAAYVRHRGIQVYMCRKQDPESKGRIENVVKYVKRNFARHRIFVSVDKLNEDCMAWLDRTGNALIHHTTKKIPAEVFALEKQHLRPVPEKIKTPSTSIPRTVRKDNTIWYEGSRYSVPLGTYDGTSKEVGVRVHESTLQIYDLDTGEIIAEHERSQRRGQLIQNTNHRRDRQKGIAAYLESVRRQFLDPDLASSYLKKIHRLHPRYTRDQLQLIQKTLDQASKEAADQALRYCLTNRLYRAVDFVDAVNHFSRSYEKTTPDMSNIKRVSGVDPTKWKVKPQIRDIEIYRRILGGG